MHIEYWWESQKDRDQYVDQERRRGVIYWINLARDRGHCEGSCEHGNEPSGYLKCCEIFELLGDLWLIKKD
jgi:hypothetical protein